MTVPPTGSGTPTGSDTPAGADAHPPARPTPGSLAGSRTHDNLVAALATAGVTNLRALWFAQQADVDGRPDAARHFRSIADDVTSNAFGLLEHLADVGDPLTGLPIGDTVDNIAAAIAGEGVARSTIDPSFVETATAEGFPEIADWFVTLAEAADRHATKLSAPSGDS